MSETKLDYEAARECWECERRDALFGYVGCKYNISDKQSSRCRECFANAARVLLALDGYLKDTLRKERESGDVWGCSDIALENGLPVDGDKE